MSYFNMIQANRKARAAEASLAKPFVVRRLTNAGQPNKMVEPKGFHTPEEARLHIAYVRGLNVGKTMRYSINGVEA